MTSFAEGRENDGGVEALQEEKGGGGGGRRRGENRGEERIEGRSNADDG